MTDANHITHTDQLQALSRLLHLLSRSLPMYLKDARPWTPPQHRQAATVLDQVAAEHARYAQLVAREIVERDGRPDPGCFPLAFTALNDVSLDYALKAASRYQQVLVSQLDQCRQKLSADPQLRQLAEEIYASALTHLEMLQHAASPSGP